MKIKTMKLSELNAADYNPRRISEEAMNGLRASIRRFGIVDPIIWNSQTKRVVGGHQRIKAAIAEGITEANVVVIDIPESEEKALNVTLNNPAIQGQFEYDMLEPLLEEIREDIGEEVYEELMLDEIELEEYEEIPEHQRKRRMQNRSSGKSEGISITDEIQEKLDATDKILFAFSGGRDSSLAFFGTMNILDLEKCELVYVDTGVEFPDMIVHVVNFANHFSMPLKVVKPEKNFIEHYLAPESHPPSAQWKDCIGKFINKPVSDYLREYDNPILIRGGRAKQSMMVEGEEVNREFYQPSGVKHYNIFNPLYSVSDDGYEKLSQEFLKEYKFWDGYERGFKRSCCWCCPFHPTRHYQAVKDNYPVLWAELIRLEPYIAGRNSNLSKAIDHITGRIRENPDE